MVFSRTRNTKSTAHFFYSLRQRRLLWAVVLCTKRRDCAWSALAMEWIRLLTVLRGVSNYVCLISQRFRSRHDAAWEAVALSLEPSTCCPSQNLLLGPPCGWLAHLLLLPPARLSTHFRTCPMLTMLVFFAIYEQERCT